MQVKATYSQQQEMAEALVGPADSLSEDECEARQDAFLRAASTYDESRGGPPEAWARQCLAYTRGDRARHQARDQLTRAINAVPVGKDPDERLEARASYRDSPETVVLAAEARRMRKQLRPQLRQDVQDALADLSEDERQVAWMRFAERRKYKDIAAELGMKLNTVKTRIDRTRQKLARALSKWQGWPDVWPEV